MHLIFQVQLYILLLLFRTFGLKYVAKRHIIKLIYVIYEPVDASLMHRWLVYTLWIISSKLFLDTVLLIVIYLFIYLFIYYYLILWIIFTQCLSAVQILYQSIDARQMTKYSMSVLIFNIFSTWAKAFRQ